MSALLVFLLLILVHELGHFAFAKLFNVKVNEFSIGMGPKLWQSKKTETKYSIRLFPLGGYCAMEGEDDTSDDERAFNNAKVYKRIIIVIAGALVNILLGFIIIMLTTIPEQALCSTTIDQFKENAVTSQYGLQQGDKIISINGSRVFVDTDITFNMLRDDDAIIDIRVERDGEKITLSDVHFPVTEVEGKKVPVPDFYVKAVKKNPLTVISYSGRETLSVVRLVWASLYDLVTGHIGLDSVSGPIGTVSAIGDAANSAISGIKTGDSQGIMGFLFLIALITINLGVFNLLPIPGLDGARLVFLLIEAVRGKPINPKYEGYIHLAGLALLILFVIIVSFSDIGRIINGG